MIQTMTERQQEWKEMQEWKNRPNCYSEEKIKKLTSITEDEAQKIIQASGYIGLGQVKDFQFSHLSLNQEAKLQACYIYWFFDDCVERDWFPGLTYFCFDKNGDLKGDFSDVSNR